MNINAKVLFASLIFVSFGSTAQIAHTSSKQNGPYDYHTGQPVPSPMLADVNVVKNVHHYHLEQPKVGYEWVHGYNDEYLLVSAKTGIITKMEYRPNIVPESKT